MQRIQFILAPKSRQPIMWNVFVKALQEIVGSIKPPAHKVIVKNCISNNTPTTCVVIKDIKLKWTFRLYDEYDSEVFLPPNKPFYLQRITVCSEKSGKDWRIAEKNLQSLLGAIDTRFAAKIIHPPAKSRK